MGNCNCNTDDPETSHKLDGLFSPRGDVVKSNSSDQLEAVSPPGEFKESTNEDFTQQLNGKELIGENGRKELTEQKMLGVAEDPLDQGSRPSHQGDIVGTTEVTPTNGEESGNDKIITRLASHLGFFVVLDHRSSKPLLRQLGLETASNEEIKQALQQIHMRIITNLKFDASQVIGVFMSRETMDMPVHESHVVNYLTHAKKVVPLLDLENSLMPQSKGVQLINMSQLAEDWIETAALGGAVGLKIHSIVRQPDADGITALVDQQFELAKQILAKGLLPVLQIIVDVKASEKNKVSRETALAERRKSEEILFDKLLSALGNLHTDERVIFELNVPAKPNTYLSLVGHPNTIRVLATPISNNLKDACRALEANYGLVGAFSNILMEGMSPQQDDNEFTSRLEETFKQVHAASTAVPIKEMQTTKVGHTAGFFACLDSTHHDVDKALARYRLGQRSDYSTAEQVTNKLHGMRSRILSNKKFSGSRVIGVLMSLDTVERSICEMPAAKFLWEEKQIVPFLKLEHDLRKEKDGVLLMKDVPKLDHVLDQAVAAGIYGVKACSMIKKPNATGIQALIAQHFSLSVKIMKKELVPVWHIEVDKEATDRVACDELLADILGRRLEQLRPEQKIVLWVAPPQRANLYLPILGHPNVVRVVFASGGNNRQQSCELLQQNFGAIGGFNRAFVEGMHSEQTEEELSALVDDACQAIFDSSRNPPAKTIQKYKVGKQDGFFAALAHIASKTEASIMAHVRYGINGNPDEIQAVFERIVTNNQFSSLHVIGVSLTPENVNKPLLGQPSAKYLWEEKHLVPFLKIDNRGFAPEKNGVQLMQDLPANEHAGLLDLAVNAGIFGTTALSKIKRPDKNGIRDLVEQQIRWGRLSLAKGLVPVAMIFIDKEEANDIGKCESLLRNVLLSALNKLEEGEEIILNFIVPNTTGIYEDLVNHPKVLRVLASAGSTSFEDSVRILSENKGLTGNFGTALLENVRQSQTYTEFTQALGETCARIMNSLKTSRREKGK